MSISITFLECVILLLIAAGLISFLAPQISRRIDARRFTEQKLFEAELTRQNKIIDAQANLLEDLSTLLWDYQLLLIAVPYYRQFNKRDLYQSALNAYEEKAENLLGKIRTEISKALHLTPAPVFEALNQLYYDQLLSLDLRVTQLAVLDSTQVNTDQEWAELHKFAVEELSGIVDNAIDNLASELNLKAKP